MFLLRNIVFTENIVTHCYHLYISIALLLPYYMLSRLEILERPNINNDSIVTNDNQFVSLICIYALL